MMLNYMDVAFVWISLVQRALMILHLVNTAVIHAQLTSADREAEDLTEAAGATHLVTDSVTAMIAITEGVVTVAIAMIGMRVVAMIVAAMGVLRPHPMDVIEMTAMAATLEMIEKALAVIDTPMTARIGMLATAKVGTHATATTTVHVIVTIAMMVAAIAVVHRLVCQIGVETQAPYVARPLLARDLVVQTRTAMSVMLLVTVEMATMATCKIAMPIWPRNPARKPQNTN